MTYMWQEILEQPDILRRCYGANRDVVKAIATEAKRRGVGFIYYAARGTSNHAGHFGKHCFETLAGLPCASASASVLTLYNGKLDLSGALVIGISQSGEALDALEVIRRGNAQGALTLSITNAPESPLAKEASFHLYCECGVERAVSATKTFTAEAFLLLALAVEFAGDEALMPILMEIPEKMAQVMQNDTIRQKAERFRYMEGCFVLGRGPAWPVAQEIALKIQESTYVAAKAFSVSDFSHGPIAMVERNTPVFVLAPSGPALPGAVAMIKKLTELGAEVLVVSGNPEAVAMTPYSIKIPDAQNDLVSFFELAVFGQMFACSLSLAKGLDPDAPRGLNKVTVTK